MRVGLFGGSFDPIHRGHLGIAEALLSAGPLDRILFLPARQSPHKNSQGAPAEDRYRMVSLAIEGDPRFELSRIDLDRPAPTYAIDTVEILRADAPPDWDPYWIVGEDNLEALATWREIDRLFELVRFLVVPRPDRSGENPLEGFPPAQRRALAEGWRSIPPVEIASTTIRQRRRRNESIAGLVPGPVADHIDRAGLYLEAPP